MIDINEMTVLIVDDMENMCRSLRAIMNTLGYGRKFLFAYSGLEAWNLLQRQSVDLAIVDWRMPVMTGVELLGRIRENDNFRDLPVVMVTAEANAEIVAEAAETDIDAYVLKPVTVKSLEDKVAGVIDRHNNPSPMTYHLRIARELEEMGEIDSAVSEARAAVEAEPKKSRPVRELGYYCLKNNELEKAEKWLLKAAKMNKMDVFAFHYLGEIYLKRDDMEKAAKYFDKAMSISPRHLERGLRFGKILIQKKMTNRAVEVFEKVFSLAENPWELREEIANFCIREGAKEYAIQLLEKIVVGDPNRGDLLFTLGRTLEELGESYKALPHLLAAAEKDRDNLEIQIHIARNYLALGYPLRAEQALRRVLKGEPEHKEARELFKQCVSKPGRA